MMRKGRGKEKREDGREVEMGEEGGWEEENERREEERVVGERVEETKLWGRGEEGKRGEIGRRRGGADETFFEERIV